MNTKKKALITAFFLVFLLQVLSNFPVTQGDPDETITRTIYADEDDGYWNSNDGDYGTARNSSTASVEDWSSGFAVGQQQLFTLNYVMRAAVYFDTSAISTGATILSANVSFKTKDVPTDDNFFMVLQNGQPSYPHKPMLDSDFNYQYYSGMGGNVSTATLSVDTRFNVTLEELSWITKGGWTKLILRSDADINYTDPDSVDVLYIHSEDAGESEGPILYVKYTTEAIYTYHLNGAYYENGDNAGGINVTFFRPTQSILEFELNQSNSPYTVTCEEDSRMVFEFELEYNESRIYYVYENSETIYVFKPEEPYYTYYFTIIDFVGITGGYLESVINVGGQDRVVERWKLDIVSDIPFTWSWGKAYTLRLVCDQGTHIFGTYIAEATTSFTVAITHDIFPEADTSLENITIWKSRPDGETIQVNYTDLGNQTTWLRLTIYLYCTDNEQYSETATATANNHNFSWTHADPTQDYSAVLEAIHSIRGNLSWYYVFPHHGGSNPWDLSFLGNWPIDSTQIIGFIIVCLVYAAGNYKNAAASMFLGTLTAAFLTWMGWLAISWSIIAFVFGLVFIIAFSIHKERTRQQ